MKHKKRSFSSFKTCVWKIGIKLIAVMVIGFIFPACSAIHISPKGKPPVETSPKTLPPSAPKSKKIPSEKTPHKIGEYDIKSPTGKDVPRIGAKTENKPAKETSYMIAGVVNLMEKAKEQMAQENFEHAFATAERALRIDDTNPKLWSLLSEIQLKRGNMLQAEQLANKSNLLAKGDNILQAKNWRIIAETLYSRGRRAEADHAIRKAEQLEE